MLILCLLGKIGGEHYNHPRGGVNYLCLPDSPRYGRYKGGGTNGGYVYGTEYQLNYFNPFRRNLHDHDAPCAVCFASSRSSVLMMPARNDCPSGWTEEYHGYLMAEKDDHRKSSEYICVDENAEAVPGSGADRNGALLYTVETHWCRSSRCSYVDGRELTCAVCTK